MKIYALDPTCLIKKMRHLNLEKFYVIILKKDIFTSGTPK